MVLPIRLLAFCPLSSALCPSLIIQLFLITILLFLYVDVSFTVKKNSTMVKDQSGVLASTLSAEPIRVAPKPKRRKQVHNIFYDDRGHPDVSDEYDYLLHNVDARPILRKLLHPLRILRFNRFSTQLCTNLKCVQNWIYLTSLLKSRIRYTV